MKVYRFMYIPTGGGAGRTVDLCLMEASEAPFRWANNFNRYYNIADFTYSIYASSSNTVQNFSGLISLFYDSDKAAYNPYVNMRSMGFNNWVDVKSWAVGDKLVYSRNGNYLEVKAKDASYIYLDYCTALGEVAYSNVRVTIQADSSSCYAGSLPWLCNFTTVNSYALNGPTIMCSNNNGWFLYSGNWTAGQSNGPRPVNDSVAARFWDRVEPIDTDDPYVDVPDSEPSGPAEGAGIPDTAGIDIPLLPTDSVLNTGFVSLFNPTLPQVKSLADYMWAGLFDINAYRKIFADPMDCILGFNIVPVNVPHGSPASVVVGNISTGIQMNVATDQWVEFDCGSITVDLPYGCYLDYAPYSKFSLYLPYIGTVELSTDDVVGRTLTLTYHIDILSCTCVAYLKCGPDVLYQFTGSCGYSIPLTGENFKQTVSNIISIAATIGGVVASGGISAPAAVAAGASITSNVMNSKPEIHRTGAIGSAAGLLGIQRAYLIMELPNACKPAKQYHYLGYPGFNTVTLSDLHGFASFESIILDGIACTSEERQMIESYCREGIYL